jgi:hypothetical protein
MKQKQVLISYFVTVCLLISACKNSNRSDASPDPNVLTHDMAASAIIQKEHFPKYTDKSLSKSGWCYMYMDADLKPQVAQLRQLEFEGYLRFIPHTIYMGGIEYADCSIEMLPKGRPYLMKEAEYYYDVAAFQEDLGSVTAISQATGANSAVVEYMVKLKSTPFTACFGIDTTKQFKYKAQFVKYDTGWRLEQSLN